MFGRGLNVTREVVLVVKPFNIANILCQIRPA